MSWLSRVFTRSVGKKQCVAVTGIFLCLFLVAHLIGNLLLYAGAEAFDAYARTLEESPLLPFAELGLLALFAAHMALTVWVTVENWRARPVRYRGKRWEGGKTLGSASMWITGPLILAFLVLHLIDFRLADRQGMDLSEMVFVKYLAFPYMFVYVAAMLVVALHVSHGFQSAFRSLGLVHPRYLPLIQWASWVLAVVAAVGFASIPLWIYLSGGPQA